MTLVDTNVFIEILQGTSAGKEAVGLIENAGSQERFAYSAITWFELCAKPSQRHPARELLAGFEPVPLTLSIAEAAADIFHRHLSKNRRHIPDALIAASAQALGAPLWTLNHADFRRIPGLRFFP